jgi:hypothetical protein
MRVGRRRHGLCGLPKRGISPSKLEEVGRYVGNDDLLKGKAVYSADGQKVGSIAGVFPPKVALPAPAGGMSSGSTPP